MRGFDDCPAVLPGLPAPLPAVRRLAPIRPHRGCMLELLDKLRAEVAAGDVVDVSIIAARADRSFDIELVGELGYLEVLGMLELAKVRLLQAAGKLR